MMPELRPEAVSLVEKVKTFIKDEVSTKGTCISRTNSRR